MTTDCSAWKNNLSCDSMVCNTDWTKTDTAVTVKNGFCKALTGSFAVCGTTCGTTKWGSDCCNTNDWSTCFINLSKKCANGGSNSMSSGATHALGQTSIISTISGHAASVNVTAMSSASATASSLSSVPSASATATAASSKVLVASTGSSSTTSSGPAATSHSAADRNLSLGSKLTVFVLLAGAFVNPIVQCLV